MSIIKSASLILVNAIGNSINKANFNILLLKRIVTSQSFAGKIVFPGGMLDKCDYSTEWYKLIHKQFSPAQLKNIICKNKLLIYKNSKLLSDINPEVFYRICAIRETFEETGILLAVDIKNNSIISNDDILNDIKKHNWQEKVSKNANFFIELFLSYNLVPDILSLYEWSEWLTPPLIDRRFHTAFYISIISSAIKTKVNYDESKCLFWKTPKNAYNEFSISKELAPPQVVELFELNLLSTQQQIQSEAERRQKSGGLSNISLIIHLSNGRIIVLPGDTRYQYNLDFDASINMTDVSIEDINKDKCLRRMSIKDGKIEYQYNLCNTPI